MKSDLIAPHDERADAAAYIAQPVKPDEFGQSGDDPLSWDAEGWECALSSACGFDANADE